MLSPSHLIESGGLLLVALFIFAESGMLVGFFLPGDTLLLTAGVFAAQGKLAGGIIALIVVTALAAIIGDNTGYHIGRTMGPRLFRKKDGLLFRQQYVEQSEKFFERYGAKAMLLAHFLPIVRTFTPIVAGVGKMPRPKFFLFDAIGDSAWAILVPLLGYWFGRRIPSIDNYVLPVVVIVVLLSFGPVVWHLLKNLLEKRKKTLN